MIYILLPRFEVSVGYEDVYYTSFKFSVIIYTLYPYTDLVTLGNMKNPDNINNNDIFSKNPVINSS